MSEKKSEVVLSNHLDKFPTFGQKVSFVPSKVPSEWIRKFPPSLCDTSLYVPLAKQVASLLSDSAETGILAGVAKVLKEDYTFSDGKIPHSVSLHALVALDDFKDIAEVSEYRDVLKAKVEEMLKEISDKETLENLKKLSNKIDKGVALTSDDVALLTTFGVSTENNTTSVKETLNK